MSKSKGPNFDVSEAGFKPYTLADVEKFLLVMFANGEPMSRVEYKRAAISIRAARKQIYRTARLQTDGNMSALLALAGVNE